MIVCKVPKVTLAPGPRCSSNVEYISKSSTRGDKVGGYVRKEPLSGKVRSERTGENSDERRGERFRKFGVLAFHVR